MTVQTTELTLPSRIEAVNEAAAAIAGILNSSGVPEESTFGVDMALREAVTNAVLHGNKQDEAKFVRVKARSSPDRSTACSRSGETAASRHRPPGYVRR